MGPRTSCKKKPSKWCCHCSPSKSDTQSHGCRTQLRALKFWSPDTSSLHISGYNISGVQKQKVTNFWTSRQALDGCATLRLELKLKEWNFTAKVQVQTLRLQRNFAKSSKKKLKMKIGTSDKFGTVMKRVCFGKNQLTLPASQSALQTQPLMASK